MHRIVPLRRLSRVLSLTTLLWLGCRTTQTPPVHPDSLLASAPGALPTAVHRFDHVLTIVLENQNYHDVIEDAYFKDLARQGASFSNLHGLFHPSYANYLAMVSGRLISTPGDRQIDVDFPTIGDRLEAQGLTWKNYAEGYPGQPGSCFLGEREGKYARKHVPFLSFSGVQRAGCKNVVPATQLEKDLKAGTFPAYAFYSPDLDHDGHDPVSDPARGLAKAKDWLGGFLAETQFPPRTLVIVTFDESEGGSRDNRIYTVFRGEDVVSTSPQELDRSYNHFNVLRTIEDNFGLAPLGPGDTAARPITGVWK